MRVIDPALGKALALSLLLHALLFTAYDRWDEPARRATAAPNVELEVTLRASEALPRLQPPLFLDESGKPGARSPARIQPERKRSAPGGDSTSSSRPAFAANSGPVLAGDAARQANTQIARELFYPPEAIARGLEGEVLVLLFLDASGNAIAARLEASSGHALLDDAAVRAAKTLRALPDSAPREALLPVRFRLR